MISKKNQDSFPDHQVQSSVVFDWDAAPPLSPEPTSRNTLRRKAATVIAGALGLVLVTVAGSSLLRSQNQEVGVGRGDDEPPELASDRPVPELGTVTTSTTIQAVELSPVSTIPSTTVVLRSPEKPTPPTTVEAKAPEQLPSLSVEEIKKIEDTTGYTELSKHTLGVIERFKSNKNDPNSNNIVIIGIDGAEMTVSVEKLKSYITAAEVEAAKRPSFTSRIQLSPGTSGVKDIDFTIEPSRINKTLPVTQYYMFASLEQNLPALAKPHTATGSAFTINRQNKQITLTLLQPQAGEVSPGVSTDDYNALAEALQANIEPGLTLSSEQILTATTDLSNLTATTDPIKKLQNARAELLKYGRDVFVGSKAYSWLYRGSATEYGRRAPSIPLVDYPKLNAYFFTTSSDEVGSLAA